MDPEIRIETVKTDPLSNAEKITDYLKEFGFITPDSGSSDDQHKIVTIEDTELEKAN